MEQLKTLIEGRAAQQFPIVLGEQATINAVTQRVERRTQNSGITDDGIAANVVGDATGINTTGVWSTSSATLGIPFTHAYLRNIKHVNEGDFAYQELIPAYGNDVPTQYRWKDRGVWGAWKTSIEYRLADSALNMANAAKNSANAATTAASTAQTAADAAKTSANNANALAVDAQNKANTADTNANSANAKAITAQNGVNGLTARADIFGVNQAGIATEWTGRLQDIKHTSIYSAWSLVTDKPSYGIIETYKAVDGDWANQRFTPYNSNYVMTRYLDGATGQWSPWSGGMPDLSPSNLRAAVGIVAGSLVLHDHRFVAANPMCTVERMSYVANAQGSVGAWTLGIPVPATMRLAEVAFTALRLSDGAPLRTSYYWDTGTGFVNQSELQVGDAVRYVFTITRYAVWH